MDEFQGMRTPRKVDIAVTGRCNLACQYCFYADEMVGRSDLSTQQWLSIFDKLGQLGVMEVALTGGEVFTRRDLFDLIDGLIVNRMRYNLLSNATMITEKVLQQFEIGRRRQRLDHIQVSVDGSCAEIHNKTRPNSFDRTIRGLRMLKEAGFPVSARVTINQHNVNDLENIAHLLLDGIGLPLFSTNETMQMGTCRQNQAGLMLSASDQLLAMATLRRLQERYPGRLNATAGPQAKARSYAEMEHARQTGEKSTRWQMGFLSACGCVFHRLSIMHDGSIVPCHILHGLTLGNILTDSFRDIWMSHPTLQALRERKQIPMQQVQGCERCEWASYCNGSCPGLAYEQTGDYNLAASSDCYRHFLAETRDCSNVTVY